MTGLELQQRLAEAGETLPVVVITGHANVPMAVKAMQQGASSVLEKPFNNAELRRAVEQALAVEAEAHAAEAERQVIKERLSKLTPAEVSVLAQIMEGRQNKVIAASLNLGVRTIESRRASIMKKVGAESLAELVRMVMSVDWKPDEAAAGDEPDEDGE
jgi:FixJ family two-component response regulator